MSEVKTDKISSVSTDGDITLDPDGTGKVVVPAAIEATTSTHANASVFKSTGNTQIMLQDTDASANDQFWGLQVSGGSFNILTCNDDRASGFSTPLFISQAGNATFSGQVMTNVIGRSDDTNTTIDFPGSDKIQFFTGGSERFRVSDLGRTEFQTPTNETGVLQSCRLDWRNENNAGIMAGIGVVRTANANAPGAFVIRTSTDVDSASNSSDGEISEKFRVAANGDLTATDTSISSNSDQRLKENIADFEYDLTKFKQLQTRTFDWKQPHLHGDKSDVRGFIAQELETVDPYWVQEIEVAADSDDYQYLPDTDLQYGSNNNYKPDDAAETDIERTARFAKTSRLGQKDAMYVSVIQQLIAKIEALEARVTALEDA